MLKTFSLTLFMLMSAPSWGQDLCTHLKEILKFANDGMDPIAFQDPYLTGSLGVEIDSDSCVFEKDNQELLVDMERSDQRSLRCLSQLTESGGTKAGDHLRRLQAMRENNLRLYCGAESDLQGALIDSLQSKVFLVVPDDYKHLSDSEKQAFLFHEQFHLLGYTHEAGPDYPDSCETCCFEAEKVNPLSPSCRTCAGTVEP